MEFFFVYIYNNSKKQNQMKVYNQPTNPCQLDSVIVLILWIRIAQRGDVVPRILDTEEVLASVLLTPELALHESCLWAVKVSRAEV